MLAPANPDWTRQRADSAVQIHQDQSGAYVLFDLRAATGRWGKIRG